MSDEAPPTVPPAAPSPADDATIGAAASNTATDAAPTNGTSNAVGPVGGTDSTSDQVDPSTTTGELAAVPDAPPPPFDPAAIGGLDGAPGLDDPPPDDLADPFFSPEDVAQMAEEERRRKLLWFIVGGSVAAAVLLIVAIVLLVKPSSSSVTASPPSSTTSSQATLALAPGGNVATNTPVTGKITLISSAGFRSAIILLDGAPVAQAAAASDPLTFTPTAGKHAATAKVTLTTGEEITSAPVELNVTGTSGSSTAGSAVAATPGSSAAPSTSVAPTTTTGAPLDPAGLSATGAAPLKFGDPESGAAGAFPGEQPVSNCAAIAPAYTGGKKFTFFGFPGGKFSYYLTQDPSFSTVEGAKVGMAADELQKLVPDGTIKTNADGITLLVKKSPDGSSEMVFYLGQGKVLFIAGSIGDLAESKQC